MINKSVRYMYGHLVDKESGKRIILTNGCEYVLIGNNSDIKKVDPYNKMPEKVKNSIEKSNTISSFCIANHRKQLKIA